MNSLLIMFFFGCSDYTLNEAKESNLDSPTIFVDPTYLEFETQIADQADIQSFTISNQGSARLEVYNLDVVGSGYFSVTAINGSQSLATGESVDVAVTYLPSGFSSEDDGAVLISSSDQSQPIVEVTLFGELKQPLATIEPLIVDMGQTPLNTPVSKEFLIKSIGEAPVTLSSLSLTGNSFTISDTTSWPITLAPGEETVLTATFPAASGGLHDATLSIDCMEPAPDLEAQIFGEVLMGNPIALCEVDPPEVQPNSDSADWIGNDSYDNDGYAIVDYDWTIISSPGGSTSSMPGGSANRNDFLPDLAGEYVAELVVTNELGVQSEPCEAILQAIPGQDLWIQMYWTHAGDDMDLHLLKPGGTLQSDSDCYYGNCVGGNLDWGIIGNTDDNPSLDLDDIAGTGPENINIADPESGFFTVYVHDYPGSTYEAGNDVTVVIFAGGSMVWSNTKTISGEGTYTPFAEINWPAGTVTGL